MHRLRLLIATMAALAAASLGAGPAGAADPTVPADAQVVGGPTRTGDRLLAWMDGGRLCTALQPKDGPATLTGDVEEGSDGCDTELSLLPLGHVTLEAFPYPPTLYGLAGADVAAVRLVTPAQTLAEAPTVEGQGTLAGLRFFLVEAPAKGPAPSELHLLDASGTVRRAEETGFARSDGGGSTGGRLRAFRVTTQRRLAPTPLEPTRHDVGVCVQFKRPGVPEVCDEDTMESDPLVTSETRTCGRGTQLSLLVRSEIDRVAAVLTDGRGRDIRLLPVPESDGRWQAGYVRVPAVLGVRRLEASSEGTVVARLPLRYAPMTAECGPRGQTTSDGPGLPADLLLRSSGLTRPERHQASSAPVATDRGAELCVGRGSDAGAADTCALPPVEPEDAWLASRTRGGPEVVFGVVPVEIARVSLVLGGGGRIDVTPTALPEGYGGRYGDVSRLVAATLPTGRRALAYELRDAAGRLVGGGLGPDVPSPTDSTRVLPPGPSPALYAAQIDLSPWTMMVFQRPERYGCLAVGPPTDGSCFGLAQRRFVVEAQCAPRRIVVYGVTPRATDRLSLRTADGRVLHGHTAPLPRRIARRFGVPGGLRGAAAIVTAPAGAAPRRLVLHEARRHAVALRLPAASEQCGYRLESDLRLPVLPPGPRRARGAQPAAIRPATASARAASSGSVTRSRHGTSRSIAAG